MQNELLPLSGAMEETNLVLRDEKVRTQATIAELNEKNKEI